MFDEDSLANYITNGKPSFPELTWLKKLIFKQLKEFCDACETDRMLCVLSPACSERILLKVRMQSGAIKTNLPQFCYAQNITNLKRFLEKKTTLYEPTDILIFNEDFIDLFFPRLSIILRTYNERNQAQSIKEIHNIIKRTNIPAINFEEKNLDSQIFRRIIDKDKLIKEGTFIYQISKYIFIVWFDKSIFICDLKSGITIANAKRDTIQDINILDLVFRIYCAEQNVPGEIKFESENEITFSFKNPLANLDPALFSETTEIFYDLFNFLAKNYYAIHMYIDEGNNLILSISYQNVESLLARLELSKLTYDAIHELGKRILSMYKT